MVEPYTIPVGTVLYTGGFTSVSTDPTRYRFFTKNKGLAAQFAKTAVSEGKTKTPVVSAFKVVKPIQIHLQKVPSSVYYVDTREEYARKRLRLYAATDFMDTQVRIRCMRLKTLVSAECQGWLRNSLLREPGAGSARPAAGGKLSLHLPNVLGTEHRGLLLLGRLLLFTASLGRIH